MAKKIRILILGDIIVDKYLFGETKRISPEAPVPIVEIDNSKLIPGGAANVANNLVEIGVSVSLFGIIGRDKLGQEIQKILKKRKVDTQFLYSSKQTINKVRIMSKSQQMLRLDFETRFSKKEASDLLKYIIKISTLQLLIN